MEEILEELRQLAHEVRNLRAPIDLKFTSLDERISQHSILFEMKIKEMESLIMNNSITVADILDRLKRIESKLNVSPATDRPTAAARLDKEASEPAPPPQKLGP